MDVPALISGHARPPTSLKQFTCFMVSSENGQETASQTVETEELVRPSMNHQFINTHTAAKYICWATAACCIILYSCNDKLPES